VCARLAWWKRSSHCTTMPKCMLFSNKTFTGSFSQRAVANRSAAWSRFAHQTLEQHRNEGAAQRASATSEMLTPLP